MHQCEYPYCRHVNHETSAQCEVCSFPLDKSLLKSADYLTQQLAKLDLGPIIDFHQILRNDVHALDKQLRMMKILKVERCLLQSVPDQVQSIQGNKALAAVVAEFPEKFVLSQYVSPMAGPGR